MTAAAMDLVPDDERAARLEARFWSKVDRSGGPDACWPWTGFIFPTGYGHIIRNISGRVEQYTHRVAWTYVIGPISSDGPGAHGWCILHRCDNRQCCNPSHLFLGTNSDNMSDMKAKGRGWWQRNRRERTLGDTIAAIES